MFSSRPRPLGAAYMEMACLHASVDESKAMTMKRIAKKAVFKRLGKYISSLMLPYGTCLKKRLSVKIKTVPLARVLYHAPRDVQT